MRTPPRSKVTVVGRASSPDVTRSGRPDESFRPGSGVERRVAVHRHAGSGDVWTADRHQRHVVEPEPDPALRLAEREPLATADVRAELAAADVDPDLGGGAFEDHPVDRALEDVVEAVGR